MKHGCSISNYRLLHFPENQGVRLNKHSGALVWWLYHGLWSVSEGTGSK